MNFLWLGVSVWHALSALSRSTPPQIRAGIAALALMLGLSLSPAWGDALVFLAWMLGGLLDYLTHRDADKNGTPDALEWLATRTNSTPDELRAALRAHTDDVRDIVSTWRELRGIIPPPSRLDGPDND